MAARPTRIVADVRLWSVCGSSQLRRRDYIRRPQLLTHYAIRRPRAHLTKGYAPNCVELEFSEVVRIQMPQKEEEFITVPSPMPPLPSREFPSKARGPLPSQIRR